MVHVKYPLFVIIFKINFYYITYHRLYLISIYYMLLNKLKKKCKLIYISNQWKSIYSLFLYYIVSLYCSCIYYIVSLYSLFFFPQKVQLDDQRSIAILFVKYLIKSWIIFDNIKFGNIIWNISNQWKNRPV